MEGLKQISSFILLLLLQILIFNHINVFGYLNPYVYVLFILMLPMNYSRATVLILAFIMGGCVDVFENSGGVHIAASVFLGWIRRPLLRVATQKRGVDFENLRIGRLSLSNFALYGILGVFIHHFFLFLIESSQLRDIGTVMVRTLVSTGFTFIFVMMVHLWNFRKKD
tara:strand:+ start:30 stop:533 length:504 start_codon:yes stop_codon:yes gene_type:complete